jgi:hypothetical protein
MFRFSSEEPPCPLWLRFRRPPLRTQTRRLPAEDGYDRPFMPAPAL